MFFKDIPLFSGLSEADHALLMQVAVRRSYPRHTLLLQEGDPGERFYLLRSGCGNFRSRPHWQSAPASSNGTWRPVYGLLGEAIRLNGASGDIAA